MAGSEIKSFRFFSVSDGEQFEQLNCSNYSNGDRLTVSGPFSRRAQEWIENFQNAIRKRGGSSCGGKNPIRARYGLEIFAKCPGRKLIKSAQNAICQEGNRVGTGKFR